MFRASIIGPLEFQHLHNPRYPLQPLSKMSAQAARAAGKAAGKAAEGNVLNKGAKRDPELYVRSSNHFPSGVAMPSFRMNWRANLQHMCRFSWASCPELLVSQDSTLVRTMQPPTYDTPPHN
jgi:hypothetical protein